MAYSPASLVSGLAQYSDAQNALNLQAPQGTYQQYGWQTGACPCCGYCPHCGRQRRYPEYQPYNWGGALGTAYAGTCVESTGQAQMQGSAIQQGQNVAAS